MYEKSLVKFWVLVIKTTVVHIPGCHRQTPFVENHCREKLFCRHHVEFSRYCTENWKHDWTEENPSENVDQLFISRLTSFRRDVIFFFLIWRRRRKAGLTCCCSRHHVTLLETWRRNNSNENDLSDTWQCDPTSLDSQTWRRHRSTTSKMTTASECDIWLYIFWLIVNCRIK